MATPSSGSGLSQVEGVSQAIISGADKSAVRVQVNPGALASTGLSLEDVRSLLSQVNVDSPKGSFEGDQLSYTLTSNDQLLEGKGYQDLILAQRSNAPIRLSALGRAFDGTENARVAGWSGTNRAVLVIIFKQSDANVIETVDRIRAVLPQLKRWIPPAVKISEISDRTTTIRASVHDVQFSLLLSIALVVMVIFLFLRRFWPTFIASITVPLALAGTFAFMYLCHYSIDNLSLMAVTISVGFVVDDAIVVIENIHRFIEAGRRADAGGPQGRAADQFHGDLDEHLADRGVHPAAVHGRADRAAVPRIRRDREPGHSGFGRHFADAHADALFPLPETGSGLPEARPLHSRLRAVLQLAAGPLRNGAALGAAPSQLHAGVAFLTLVATVLLYRAVPKGFFPQQDTGIIFGTTDAAQDISFAAMAELQQKVARIVLDDPAVATMASFIGAGMGASTVNNGRMFITLKPRAERNVSADQVINRLRKKLAEVIGVTLFLQASQDIRVGGRMSRAQFQYALQSGDLDELNRWSTLLVDKLQPRAGIARRQQRPADAAACKPWWSLTAMRRHAWASRPSPLTTPSTTPSASGRSRPCIGNTTSST